MSTKTEKNDVPSDGPASQNDSIPAPQAELEGKPPITSDPRINTGVERQDTTHQSDYKISNPDQSQKPLTQYERKILQATWAGIIVAILTIGISGFFSYHQLTELIEGGKQTNTLLEQHNREIAALEKLAEATRNSVMVVQNAEKAKIGFRISDINWQKRKISIALENVGRVSAEDIYLRVKVEQRSMSAGTVNERIDEFNFKSIPPGIPRGVGFHVLDTALDIVNLRGRVFYTDGFQIRTNTGFCYSFLHTSSGEVDARSCNEDARDKDLELDKENRDRK